MELKTKADAIAQAAKAENRGYSEAEVEELRSIEAELNVMAIDTKAETFKAEQRNINLAFAEAAVEAAKNNQPMQVRAADLAGADGFISLSVGDIIEPLEKGMILDKVGCKIQTGLDQEWKYPVVSAIEATVAGETANVADTQLTLGAVKPVPQRVALSVPVTTTALSVTNANLRDTVINQVYLGAVRVLNKWMFDTTAIATGVNGLFVNPGTSATATVAGKPTYAEICALKGAVDAKGVKADSSAAYVMTAAMKAYLEATPKGSTTGGMICENDKINGIPVFTTEYAPAGKVEFGYFSYALVGQFGAMDVLVDPYSKSADGIVRFVLRANFDIKAARAEAFGILG